MVRFNVFFLTVNSAEQNPAESMAMFVYFTFGELTFLEDVEIFKEIGVPLSIPFPNKNTVERTSFVQSVATFCTATRA